MVKLCKRKIRRNTVVIHKDGSFYGRVIRVLPDGNIFWLSSGLHFHISDPKDLEVGYKGYWKEKWDFTSKRWIPMTNLRRLKKRAIQFHHEFAHNTPLDYVHIQRD